MECLDDLQQNPVRSDMNIPLSLFEFENTIRKLILHKAPGSNGVSPNAIKALNKENRLFLFQICYDYFENDQEIEEWQKGCLKILPKKGNLSDPNNWRGIDFLDVVSKVMSLVITSRLQHILELESKPILFGASPKTGCPEGSFSLKSLLQIRKEHDLNSWVVFADLIKAFDSIHHGLMFELLKKFGVPTRPLNVIKKLYKNFMIEIKVGKKKTLIDYSTGVKQGDNLAPILFIIVMQFLAELLETKWRQHNIYMPSFLHDTNKFYNKGQLISHNNKRRFLTKDELFLFLYVDDGASIFSTRRETILGTEICFEQMKRLGLNMHTGDGKKPSKTEAVFFPSRSKIQSWIKNHENNLISSYNPSFLDLSVKKKAPLKSRKFLIDRQYAIASETKSFIISRNRHITFTLNFKYLGSWISYDLDDTYDINSRIKRANQAMGALKFFWLSEKVDILSKYLIYMAVPVNLLLWGCESWALTKVSLKKLEVFHMRSLRRILKIKWSDVIDEKITNVSVRKNFNNIRNIDSLIAKRRLLFLGKIIRLPRTKIPSRLISAFCPNKRPIGRPNYTIRHSMLNSVKKIIPTADKYGSFHTWAHIANNELVWSILVNNIGLDDPQPCNYSPEWEGEIPESPTPPKPSPPPEPPPFQSPPPKSSLPHSPSPRSSPSNRTQNTCFSFRIRKLFEILEIDPGSSKRKARLAYMLLARKYHPDKWDANISDISFETSVEKFKDLSNAYDELKKSNLLY